MIVVKGYKTASFSSSGVIYCDHSVHCKTTTTTTSTSMSSFIGYVGPNREHNVTPRSCHGQLESTGCTAEEIFPLFDDALAWQCGGAAVAPRDTTANVTSTPPASAAIATVAPPETNVASTPLASAATATVAPPKTNRSHRLTSRKMTMQNRTNQTTCKPTSTSAITSASTADDESTGSVNSDEACVWDVVTKEIKKMKVVCRANNLKKGDWIEKK